MNDKNVLCTMTAYYYNRINYNDEKLNVLDNDVLQEMFRYRVNKPYSMIHTVSPDFHPGTTIPVSANLIMINKAQSVPGVSVMTEPGTPFPGDYIDEWDDMFDYSNLYLNRNNFNSFVMRAIIRGICNEFASVTDYSGYNMDSEENCRTTLRRVMHQFTGVYPNTTISIDDRIHYWTDGRVMNLCLFCACERHEKYTAFYSTKDVVSSSEFLNAVLHTPNVF